MKIYGAGSSVITHKRKLQENSSMQNFFGLFKHRYFRRRKCILEELKKKKLKIILIVKRTSV